MIRTNEAAEKYRKLYRTRQEKREIYEENEYDRRMTPRDKKIAKSRFTFRGNRLQEKHYMLMVIMFFVLLIFIDTSFPYKSNFLIAGYGLIFMLLYLAFFYNVTKKYYWIVITLFLVLYLTTKNYSFLDWDFLREEIKKSENTIKK